MGCEIAVPSYGRRRFNLVYQAVDYDGAFWCGIPDVLVAEAGHGNVLVTHVDILFEAAASTGTYVFFRLTKTFGTYLTGFTLTTNPQTVSWSNIDVCSIPSTMSANRATWFQVSTIGGVAGDDALIAIRGYIEQPDAVTPVDIRRIRGWPRE